MTETLTAARVIALLGLEPHPEGGHFRETFRDSLAVGGRAASTAIYYMLARGERSRWHRVDAAEVWHWYAGAPLRLDTSSGNEGHGLTSIRLGSQIEAGQQPQAIVPAGVWQQAESLGDWTLVGCTVAPAFSFAGFELAPDGWAPSNR